MSSGDPFQSSRPLDRAQLEGFAQHVIRSLDVAEPGPPSRNLDDVTQCLLRASLQTATFDLEELQTLVDRHQLSASDVVDVCIPNVARRAGQMWVDDAASFTEVTLAGARLYALCKTFSDEWRPRGRDLRGLSILVATAPGEQHMIGAVVLTSQLRRQGHSVQLVTGAVSREIVARLSRSRFDAVMVSCATSAALDTAGRCISEIRFKVPNPPRLILGGAIEQLNREAAVKVEADVVTSSCKIALSGLVTSVDPRDLMVAQ